MPISTTRTGHKAYKHKQYHLRHTLLVHAKPERAWMPLSVYNFNVAGGLLSFKLNARLTFMPVNTHNDTCTPL